MVGVLDSLRGKASLAGQWAKGLSEAGYAGFANDGIGRALLHAGAGCISAAANGGIAARVLLLLGSPSLRHRILTSALASQPTSSSTA